MRDNSVFLGLCTSHVSRPGWIKKTWYSSLVSSSTRKSGTYLIIFQTVFWTQIFPKLMVMGHFALKSFTSLPRFLLRSQRGIQTVFYNLGHHTLMSNETVLIWYEWWATFRRTPTSLICLCFVIFVTYFHAMGN